MVYLNDIFTYIYPLMKHKTFNIEIDMQSPCHEDREKMLAVADGRFCLSCQKTVIDMSDWTDQEFIHFFHRQKQAVCCYVDQSKLNRLLKNQAPTPIKKASAFTQWFAALLSFCSLGSLGAKTANASPAIVCTDKQQQTENEVVISGEVKKEYGGMLPNVRIEFLGQFYQTDSLGRFEIRLNPAEVKAGLLIFNYDGLDQEVRNYNTVMGSTTYTVSMHPPRSGRLGGMPMVRYYIPDSDANHVVFTGNSLDKVAIKKLKELAQLLRNNPNFTLGLQTYYHLHKKNALDKAVAVRKYLTEHEGIDVDRLALRDPVKSNNKQECQKVYFVSPEH